MDEINDTPKKTVLDQGVDRAIKPDLPINEIYTNETAEKALIAAQHIPPKDSEEPKRASWTMQEIERQIIKQVLPGSRQKLDAFTVQHSKRNDLRMPLLSRMYGEVLKRDHRREMTSGPKENRVREFDVQSQTMRMVTANAAMGTYQFQRNSMLPYMRKSLAQGYQKISLLKDISGGIFNLEKAVVSKLEAIKVNTAAVVPRPKTYLSQLWGDIKNLNRARVAGNISNYMLNKKEQMYNRVFSPIAQRIHDRMSDPSKKGGINGVGRDLTTYLKRKSREQQSIAAMDTAGTGVMQHAKISAARFTSRAARMAARLTGKFQLGEERNRNWSDKASEYTDDLRRFNPFGSAGPAGSVADSSTQTARFSEQFAKSFDSWRREYRTDHDKMIDALMSINSKIACCCDDAGVETPTSRRRRKTRKPDGSAPSPAAAAPAAEETPDVSVMNTKPQTTPSKPGNIFSRIKSFRFSKTVPAQTAVAYDSNDLSPIPMSDPTNPRPVVESQPKTNVVGSMLGKMAAPFSAALTAVPAALAGGAAVATAGAAEAKQALSPLALPGMARVKQSTDNLRQQADLDRAFVTKMFEGLGKRIDNVTGAVTEGNEDRSKFEKVQTKWEALREKLSAKPRKNSYEDLMAQREANKKERKNPWAEAAKGVGKTAVTTAGALASGDVTGALGNIAGDVTDWATDEATEYLGDKAKEKGSKLWRKAKIMGSRRGRRLGRAVVRGESVRAAERAAERAALRAQNRGLLAKAGAALWSGAKGGTKFAAKGAWGLTKAAVAAAPAAAWGGTKLAARGAWGLTKFGGRGIGSMVKAGAPMLGKRALGLAKGIGPGLAVGLAADAAGDWINKNTTGTTQRLGNTAAKAASWGATGATIGSVIPVVGTAWGAGIGAAAGALAANMDLVSKGLSWSANKAFDGLDMVGKAGSWTWKNLFGSDAKIDKWGKVQEKETPSIIGHVKTMFFGRDAKYAKSGDIISDGKTGIFPELRRGFDLFFFGVKDPKDKNKFKPGSSMLGQITTSFFKYFDSFKKTMSEIPSKIMDALSGLGTGIKNAAGSVGNAITEGVTSAGAVVSGSLHDMVQGAMKMVGLNEQRDTGVIQAYMQKGGALTQGVDPRTTAWCAAFVNATLAQAGIKGSGSLTASSFKNWGVGVDPRQVREGDVLVEDKGASPGQSGDHVGIATGATRMANGQLQIEMLSGNSGNSITRVFYNANRLKIRRGESTGGGASQNPSTSGMRSPFVQGQAAASPTGGAGTGSFLLQNGAKPSPFQGPAGYAMGGGSGSTVSEGGRGKFNDVVNYLMSKKGWGKTAAQGIAANLYGESGLKTGAVNTKGGGQGAKGVAQWRGPRITEIEQRWGKPIEKMSLYEQLDAVDMEIREGKHVTASQAIPNGNAPLTSAINSAPNIEEVIRQMVHRYERPSKTVNGLEAESMRRIKQAYSLVAGGAFGQDAPKPPAPKPATAPAAKPKTAAPKPAAAKPAAPAAKPAPKQEDHSVMSQIGDALTSIKGYFTSDNKPAAKPAGNTAVVVNNNTKVAWPSTASTTMSMSKSSVRTGT